MGQHGQHTYPQKIAAIVMLPLYLPRGKDAEYMADFILFKCGNSMSPRGTPQSGISAHTKVPCEWRLQRYSLDLRGRDRGRKFPQRPRL